VSKKKLKTLEVAPVLLFNYQIKMVFSKIKICYDILRWRNSLWLKKKSKNAKNCPKAFKNYWFKISAAKYSSKKKLVIATRSVRNINVTFSNFKDFVWIFHAKPKNFGFYFSSYHYSQPYEKNSCQRNFYFHHSFSLGMLLKVSENSIF
jgi:hypothetical protein